MSQESQDYDPLEGTSKQYQQAPEKSDEEVTPEGSRRGSPEGSPVPEGFRPSVMRYFFEQMLTEEAPAQTPQLLTPQQDEISRYLEVHAPPLYPDEGIYFSDNEDSSRMQEETALPSPDKACAIEAQARQENPGDVLDILDYEFSDTEEHAAPATGQDESRDIEAQAPQDNPEQVNPEQVAEGSDEEGRPIRPPGQDGTREVGLPPRKRSRSLSADPEGLEYLRRRSRELRMEFEREHSSPSP